MTLLSISIIIKKRGSDEVNNIWTQLKLLLLYLIKSPYPVDIISNISDIPFLSISTIIKESGSKEVNKTWTQLELLLLSLIKSPCQVDTISKISDIIKKPGTEDENNMWTQLKKELSNPIPHPDCIENTVDVETNGEIETDEDKGEIETDLIFRKKWYGPGGMKELIFERTGCKPYIGSGINYFKDEHKTTLNSVDGTPYYDDNLEDPKKPIYTLYGPSGDQNENDTRNKQLLKKSKHIYLFRRTKEGYIWYGKYKIIGKESKSHIGKDYIMRNIINLTLNRCL